MWDGPYPGFECMFWWVFQPLNSFSCKLKTSSSESDSAELDELEDELEEESKSLAKPDENEPEAPALLFPLQKRQPQVLE